MSDWTRGMPPYLVAAIQRYDEPPKVRSLEDTEREIARLERFLKRETQRGHAKSVRNTEQRIGRAIKVRFAHRRATAAS